MTTTRLREVLLRSRELGFLGPGEVDQHVHHAQAFLAPLAAVGEGGRVLDLGSGGGVPGLVLAVRRPDLDVVLLDAMSRRCTFLEAAAAELGLAGRVRVVCERSEVAARDPELRGTFDVVVARSFAAPPVTAECAAGFLRVGGRLLVSEPPDHTGEERWPAAPLDELGLTVGRRWSVEGAATIQELRSVRPCPERYPRRVGVPAKRPLY